MSKEPEARYPCRKVAHGDIVCPSVSVVVLETFPKVKKSVTKRYPDGRTLSLLLVDEKMTEKSMTFGWTWDYVELRRQKEEGAGINFQYWEKAGLEMNLTLFGTYLVGKMFTLDFARVTNSNLRPVEDWRDEIDSDIAFPMVDPKKVVMQDGFSANEKENLYMRSLMHVEVVDALSNHESENKKKAAAASVSSTEEQEEGVKKQEEGVKKQEGGVTPCTFCGDIPCVWLGEHDNVVMTDKLEHDHIFGVENKTRRRVAYRYMFRILNGGAGQKGVRKRQPECVENGIRALFPDKDYMGFKEK
jgi:hypothetical protein